MLNLGKMYLNGRGVERDVHKAFQLILKSAIGKPHPKKKNN